MKLIVFCHSGLAYLVPKKIIKEAAIHDRNYEEGTLQEMQEAEIFFDKIREKYKPIIIGHLLTGDVG